MHINRQKLAEVIAKQTLNHSDIRKLPREIAMVLLHENQTVELESLVRDVIKYRAENGVVDAIAVSAYDLSDEVIKELKSIIKKSFPDAKVVNLTNQTDPKVIGGVRLQFVDKQLDLTVSRKLASFKRLTALEGI